MRNYHFKNFLPTITAKELFQLSLEDMINLLVITIEQAESLHENRLDSENCQNIAKYIVPSAKLMLEWRIAIFDHAIAMTEKKEDDVMWLELLSGLCCEWLTPITTMIGFAQLISFGAPCNQNELDRFIDTIRSKLNSMYELACFVQKNEAFPWHGV